MTCEPKVFANRREAGKILGSQLKSYANSDAVALALPRGGVPVAYEVAHYLHCDLDVFNVRKIGVPGQEELAMGAVASGGMRVLNEGIVGQLGIGKEQIDEITEKEMKRIEERDVRYRQGRPLCPLKGRTCLLIDDGMATGSTMKAAAVALRKHRPALVVIAVPVADRNVFKKMQDVADKVICSQTPDSFQAVGQWYRDFNQTTDEEVIRLLHDQEERISSGK